MVEESKAYEHAKAALKEMAKHGVKPTPHNYAIWYNYTSNADDGLVNEINTMIHQRVTFTTEMNDYLYTTYIAEGEDQFLRETAANAKNMIHSVMNAMHDFSGETEAFGQSIDEQAKQLPADGEELEQVVKNLMTSTQSMRISSSSMNKKLEESRKEIEELRANLAAVTMESEKDFLTEIANRKALEKQLPELMQEAKAEEQPLCLMMLDIDYFKKFNDTYGHLIGDQVLKIVAKTLVSTVKGADLVARYGGEEFCVVLPHTPLAGGMVVANAIREAIASKELKRKDTGETYGTVTVSIGVSLFQANHDTIPTFIKRADDALYQSKKKGRNCVTQESGLSH